MNKNHLSSPLLASVLLLVGFALWVGCRAQPPKTLVSWTLYQDPHGRFELSYPAEWSRHTATTEVQFFDTLEDGTNSVKVILFEETRSLETIQTLTEEDRSTQTEEWFEEGEINGVEVLFRQAHNAWGESETVYYRLDEAVIALVALYFDDKEDIRAQVRTMQSSFRTLKTQNPQP